MFLLSNTFLWSSLLLTLHTHFHSTSSKSPSRVSLTKKKRPGLGGVLLGILGGGMPTGSSNPNPFSDQN